MRWHHLVLMSTASLLGGFGAVIAVGIVADPGPNMEYVPQMAPTPFVGEDGRTLYVQAHEVTVAEWNRCHADGACKLLLRPPPGGDKADWPATGLNWLDVNEYLAWINNVSRHNFRLPTWQEWFAMAQPVLPEEPDPIFTDPALRWASAYLLDRTPERRLRPSGAWSVTEHGIADLDGSVWEWTQECYVDIPEEQKAHRCPAFVVGGEHKAVISFLVRDPARGGCAVGLPPPHLGLRLVTDDPLPSADAGG